MDVIKVLNNTLQYYYYIRIGSIIHIIQHLNL